MGLFNKSGEKKSPFSKSAAVLGDKGFCGEYVEILKEDIANCVKNADIAKGQSYLCNALIITGNLSEAYDVYLNIDIKKVPKNLTPNLLQNVIFSLFVRDEFSLADEIYKTQNEVVLSEHTDNMRRTLAIHEHINGRYENAVTILVKLLETPTRFIDICLVKSMLRLDMFGMALEVSPSLDSYDDLGELGKEVSKLKLKIAAGNARGIKKKMGKKR